MAVCRHSREHSSSALLGLIARHTRRLLKRVVVAVMEPEIDLRPVVVIISSV
jgi:hypothetical protein